MDLDDVPVTGAPHKDFETLLQEQLAKEGGGGGMGGGAEPAKNAKTPPGATPRSASARKFLRKGARNERTTLTPPGIKASHPTLKPSKTTGSKAAASHTSKTIDYGFDDSEPIEDVKPKAVKPKGGRGRVPSPGATKRQDARLARENDEAAELAEFEALERELAVVDPSSEQRTAPGPSFKPAAKKSAQAAALRAAATRALEDENGESDSSDGDDEFAVEDHFGGALRSASHVKGPSVPVAFDDDEEFSEDEAADAAAYDNYPQNDHFRRAEPSSIGVNSVDTARHQLESVSGAAASVHDDAPGDGAPALIQSLFYNGNEGRKGSRVGSRVVNAGYEPDAGAKRLPNSGSLSTQKANSDAAMAKAQAAAASAAEVKAAADDASARVKRERDRLEREKSAFAQEKRAAARERQTWEKQRKDATASIAAEREEIKADADRLRRDRQRLERDSKRVLSALPTKKERTEMDDLTGKTRTSARGPTREGHQAAAHRGQAPRADRRPADGVRGAQGGEAPARAANPGRRRPRGTQEVRNGRRR
jgi:centromere protein J